MKANVWKHNGYMYHDANISFSLYKITGWTQNMLHSVTFLKAPVVLAQAHLDCRCYHSSQYTVFKIISDLLYLNKQNFQNTDVN